MYIEVAILMVVAGAQALSFPDVEKVNWNNFISVYNKRYSAKEALLRFKTFKDNKNIIAEHNKRWAAGKESYELGLNEFADMLPAGFEQYMLGSTYEYENINDSVKYVPAELLTLDEEVDWRKKGAATPVKSQGRCGSCWAFSATGVLEGQHFQKTKQLISLSEQNLVDYSTANHGCSGGTPARALRYIQYNGGISTEAAYPYKAARGTCKFDRNISGATVTDIITIKRGSESDLQNAVATKGPIAVAIDASKLHFYNSGLFNNPSCSHRLSHAVLVVGYGKDPNGSDYWLVKNSWGKRWGDNGYIRMARNRNNQCGIADKALYPLV